MELYLGTIYDSGGLGASYGYNENWGQLIQCSPSKVVSLQLTQLALGPTQCRFDILKIFDGPSSNSPSLFISGCPTPVISRASPLVFFASQNKVHIRFTTDGVTSSDNNQYANGDGYSIKYSCQTSIADTSTSGTLYDTGGLEGDYGNDESLVTRITCPIGHGPRLSFTQLDIDGTMTACNTDSVQVYYDNALKQSYCGTLTGSALPQVSVPASTAFLVFTSDSTITRPGYTLNYHCEPITTGIGFN